MHRINVSLVYATPEKQWIYEANVARGTTALELLEASDFNDNPGGLPLDENGDLRMGVFAEKVAGDYLLQDGDRLEIYRPLKADPKEVRRQLALMGKTMGRK